jgi:hypothetical protein
MARFGLEDRWSYHFPTDDRWFGLSDPKRREVLQSADLLLNVSGTLVDMDGYRRIPRRAYIDSDPVFTQLKLDLNQAEFKERVDAHNVHFTFAEQLPPEIVPHTGHSWRPTRSPIVLDEWTGHHSVRNVFTTVMSWTSYRPLQYEGRTYGQKDVEFKAFRDLPHLASPARFEIAMPPIHHLDWETEPSPLDGALPAQPAARLARHGWTIVDPASKCGTLDAYRAYVQGSLAEWSVAKNGYVQGRCGWFSCRSSCYLAAGRPVVVQDTGFSRFIPTGQGLLAFTSLDEAVDAVREVTGNPERHSRAAREVAAGCFDARILLPRLVDEAMATSAQPVLSEVMI